MRISGKKDYKPYGPATTSVDGFKEDKPVGDDKEVTITKTDNESALDKNLSLLQAISPIANLIIKFHNAL